MTSSQIAEAIRRESGILQELLTQLSRAARALTSEQNETWLTTLRDEFTRFRAHIHKEMALQAAGGGFLSEVTDRRPTLSREAERVENEYAQIVRLADDLHRSVSSLKLGERVIIEDVQRRIRFLVDEIGEVQEQRNLLVTLAFSLDIGAAD